MHRYRYNLRWLRRGAGKNIMILINDRGMIIVRLKNIDISQRFKSASYNAMGENRMRTKLSQPDKNKTNIRC